MKTNLKLLLIAGIALTSLSGCATDHKTAAAAPAVHHSLEGGPWKVVSFDDGSTVPANVTAEITFEPGDHGTSKVFGNGGCNRFSGGWSQKGSTIKIGPLASTMMACEPDSSAFESKFHAVLNAASKLSWDADGTAKISTADGKWVKLRRAAS
ncbi:META domain-containing protein [Polymorphobacter arshaanensis]|uniref:META domain-containing protein n=1 Tax=Glacieibacterium arshaanense TaxID=2511025 RepID=A0A4Y9EKD2_9SPHN|nr:META domain-containing protein [Polymorphobacter arshaanensis]TFU01223.1 META domain-containing protein [Polymorphobacter arshaanensis]